MYESPTFHRARQHDRSFDIRQHDRRFDLCSFVSLKLFRFSLGRSFRSACWFFIVHELQGLRREQETLSTQHWWKTLFFPPGVVVFKRFTLAPFAELIWIVVPPGELTGGPHLAFPFLARDLGCFDIVLACSFLSSSFRFIECQARYQKFESEVKKARCLFMEGPKTKNQYLNSTSEQADFFRIPLYLRLALNFVNDYLEDH